MRLSDVKKFPTGIYVIRWKRGGKSLASVGRTIDGTPWLAPTNWVHVSTDDRAKLVWKMVESMEYVTISDRLTQDL